MPWRISSSSLIFRHAILVLLLSSLRCVAADAVKPPATLNSPKAFTNGSTTAVASTTPALPAPPDNKTPVEQQFTVTVNATSTVFETSEVDYHGINLVATGSEALDSPGTLKALSQMGMQFFRFPGGSVAEIYNWKDPLASGLTALTPDRIAGLAKSCGARIIFQTNIAGDKTDKNAATGQEYKLDSSAAQASEWVKYSRDNKWNNISWWEIGNEPEKDLKGLAGDSQTAIYELYNRKFAEQATLMKQTNSPRPRIIGPSSADWYWWACRNLDKFMKAHGNKTGSGLVDAISLHWYPEGGDISWEQGRSSAQTWPEHMRYINTVLRQNDTRNLPVYVTEWNWGGATGESAGKLSNALGCADTIGTFLRTGVAGHAFFSLQGISRRRGCMAARTDSRPYNTVTPTYYALTMAGRLSGKVLDTTCSADDGNVLSAYATKRRDGSVQVMLINKTRSITGVDVNLVGSTVAGKSMKVYSLRGTSNSIDDEDVVYNGVSKPRPWESELPQPQLFKAQTKHRQILQPYAIVVLVFVK